MSTLPIVSPQEETLRPVSPSLRDHPCYSPSAVGKHARLHLPVAPSCNIQCGFCARGIGAAQQPGVTKFLLQPEKTVELVAKAKSLCPTLTVVGVAGPGDPLATEHALQALENVHVAYPELTGCLSTNGLNLPGQAERIYSAGVRALTVTVNAIDPEILSQICGAVRVDGQWQRGVEGAKALINAQTQGIQEAVAAGLHVKINTVLTPGINDNHVQEVAEHGRKLGASLMNVIPLIPAAKLSHISAPDCSLIDRVRREAEQHLPVFRHCKRCRADACGIPGGKDYGGELFQNTEETFSHG